MPSNHKRKHHRLPGHSSNGELPLTSSADNRPDVVVGGEHSNRQHLANGKENLLTEALPVTKAPAKGPCAEIPSHCDILARTSGDGVPAENSYLSETAEKCMNGHASFRHGVAMGKRSNGSKHLCSSPACAHVQHGDSEAVVNLKQLNRQLLEQVCLMRSEESLLREKLKSLQIQLEQNSAHGDVLLAEKTLLENQKIQFELDLKASNQEVAKLGLERLSLLEVEQSLRMTNHELQRDFSDCREKVSKTNEKLKVSVHALASADEKIKFLEAEIELLHLEQQRLNEEILFLRKRNSDLQCAMKDLQMERECLESELGKLRSSYANVEGEVAETTSAKEALETKLASRSLQREGFQMQLEGAWQQIQSLEAQQEASMAERFDLEKQIMQLENALVAARDECEETFCMLELEREEKLSLRTTLGKAERMSEALQNEFDSMNISTANLQMSSDYSQQQISALEAKVACLLEEKAVLERAKASLKDKLEQSKTRSDDAFVASEQEIDLLKAKLHKLEEALAFSDILAVKDDKCVRDIKSEVKDLSTTLKQRKRLADVSISLAAVSTGALVVLGIIFILGKEK